MIEKTTHEHCPTPGPLMIKKNNSSMEAALFRPACKRWSCPHCGPVNASEWGYIAWSGTQQLKNEGLTVVFATLTSHEKLGPERTFEVWPDAWKKLRQRIVREYGKPEYFMVPEKHKTGRLHMHALISTNIDKKWLKTASRACGLGYMADVRIVEEAIGAAFYTAKYLTKFGVAWPDGWRRVRLSRDWPRVDKIEVDPEPGVECKLLSTDVSESVIQAHVTGYGSLGYAVTVSKSCYYDQNGIK